MYVCIINEYILLLLANLKVNTVLLGIALSAMIKHSTTSSLWNRQRTTKELLW